MNNNDLIDIHGVTKIFQLSVEAIRKYKAMGLIESYQTVGRKDLYIKRDIIRRERLIHYLKKDGKSLKEIMTIINKKREIGKLTKKGQKTILIIEDEPGAVQIFKEALEEHFSKSKIQICEAMDGWSGIELAIAIVPDVIILDMGLPGLSGLKVKDELEKDPKTSHVGIIGISGNVKIDQDFNSFLTKPVKISELTTAVETLLKKRKRGRSDE